MSESFRDNLKHCVVKFFVTYDIVVICVYLSHDLVPYHFIAFLMRRLADSAFENLL